jgi:hypothetical protein
MVPIYLKAKFILSGFTLHSLIVIPQILIDFETFILRISWNKSEFHKKRKPSSFMHNSLTPKVL